ncbi:hypothetical protein BX604_7295 [Burkholderia sp. JKS000303]|nr:hypothetical protein BX604_7295 [Burkholderia sp. JKS000303]
MHPTAALLALHGCQFYSFEGGALHAALARAPERNLSGLFYLSYRGDWERQTVLIPERYHRCDWSDIPDRKWDVIRPDLLHRFIESITA